MSAWILPARWRIEIEARDLQALQSALDTGVEYALAKIKGAARTTSIGQMDAVIGLTISYVRDSVPDAIQALGRAFCWRAKAGPRGPSLRLRCGA